MNMAVGCEQMKRKPREDKGEKRLPNYIENLQAAARKLVSIYKDGEEGVLGFWDYQKATCAAEAELVRCVELMDQIENHRD